MTYTKVVPFKDFNGKPRNQAVHFNLTEREIFKLLPEFRRVFEWQDSMSGEDVRTLDVNEVKAFYDDFEEILLSAWGVPSEDGLHFRKGGRYEFEESALFNACMVMFVTDPAETTKLIQEILPKDMEELARTADENTLKMLKDEGTDADLRKQVEELRAQLQAGNAIAPPASSQPQV